ncbi:conserved protein of unknown function (plasmid) [Rhodovastum atsumiense]|uniref:Uncharacterized protein n=1 Tax=Rhodovastum atsumiense TaxID=504468 RepID=A0A5M6IN25_9PROT|nr:hypothetical protein [Rhodovastum atsumiense]KAA5609661.1 hypothetical protein F1189_23140 [Rhodovastum atsumiense]CAH2606420.1 conserved protein of unknown function [Rhodovastum atsumiense]
MLIRSPIRSPVRAPIRSAFGGVSNRPDALLDDPTYQSVHLIDDPLTGALRAWDNDPVSADHVGRISWARGISIAAGPINTSGYSRLDAIFDDPLSGTVKWSWT